MCIRDRAAGKLKPGLGTDGMQSNMIREAKEGMLIRSSHLRGGEAGFDYQTMLFEHNPRIATSVFGRKIGKVEPGHRADLAFFDYKPRTDDKDGNVLGHVFFGLDSPSDVMSGGKMRIQDHRVLGFDEPAAKIDSAVQSGRLWQMMQ